MKIRNIFVLTVIAMTLNVGTAVAGSTAYLGPAGSWTPQACLDLFGDKDLVPATKDEMFKGYASGKFDQACVPLTTSVVGVTPYMDNVLDLPGVRVVAEYPKMLGYSLLVRPGAKSENIKELLAHPVAFEEVKPWVDKEMPTIKRTNADSGGAAAKTVADSPTLDKASFGPKVGASVYNLVSLVDGIEEGPHNVTRWWVLGRTMPAPTGNDKTSLVVDTSDSAFGKVLADFTNAGVQILNIYERPSKKTIDSHRYLIEGAGHAKVGKLRDFLATHSGILMLG
ncbi:prephenate dehydratase [Herbaspirillum rubrisubalbicans Os34]|uniref:prephenate dehydratase n=1 Tax=Herbaspirillum rubrisubalbicans Os34 TaxID=1235827 RepID=A0A6M3ZZW2_9BURK|nr:prephenate dehydratase domain-containing protein [Herbaspirillum rubrisubalbicans]QJQ03430.1 prephenate dehydratase [Herbaspirillum rubrisubalbicans Os34]